jgi:hypothetical protein
LSKAPRANPKKEGRDNSPQTKSPAKHKDPTDKHLAQLQTVSTSLTEPTPKLQPPFFSFSSKHQQAKDVIQVFKAGLGGGGAQSCSLQHQRAISLVIRELDLRVEGQCRLLESSRATSSTPLSSSFWRPAQYNKNEVAKHTISVGDLIVFLSKQIALRLFQMAQQIAAKQTM